MIIEFKKTGTPWIKGWIDENYQFEAKVYNEPSKFGINNGRVSKLRVNDLDVEIANYQREWVTYPKDVELVSDLVDMLERVLPVYEADDR